MNAIIYHLSSSFSPGTWLDCHQLKSIAGSAVSSSLKKVGYWTDENYSPLPALAVHQLPPHFLSDGVMVVDLKV